MLIKNVVSHNLTILTNNQVLEFPCLYCDRMHGVLYKCYALCSYQKHMKNANKSNCKYFILEVDVGRLTTL